MYPSDGTGKPPGHVCPPPVTVQRLISAPPVQPSYVVQVTSPFLEVSRGVTLQPLRVAQPDMVWSTEGKPIVGLPACVGDERTSVPWNWDW